MDRFDRTEPERVEVLRKNSTRGRNERRQHGDNTARAPPGGSMQAVRPANGGGRRATGATQLPRFPSLHRASFLEALQDQIAAQVAAEQERERAREVARIHSILRKAPESRDSQDVDALYDWVLKNGSTNKIFHGAQEIICKTICREMTLLELPPKGVVCYQGDFGDTFYVIISGSVSLFIDPKAKLRAMQEQVTATPERSDRYFRGLQQQQHPNRDDVDDSEDANPQQTKSYGSFIKQITDGGTFGELAVLDPTARRSCTVMCDVPTSFICLKRGAYQRLIRITNSNQLDFTPAEFLETLFFFDAWPHGELTRLSNRLRHLSFAADSFLTRIGSEANAVYFIYSGIVQETRPMIQHLNANGSVYKCTAVNAKDPRKQQGNSGLVKDKAAARKVALELNLYQDHDICGEYPILFDKPLYTTDLLAVTDVKALIMDRETWKEMFFMHGLEHILESYNKFLKLAQARENWRMIRMKLALANPGLTLTISTKEMMLDGKCMCGWCGSPDHITGDQVCASLIACRKKEADREKRPRPARPKRIFEMGVKALAVKNTMNFVNTLVESVGAVPNEAIAPRATKSSPESDQTLTKLRVTPAHPPLISSNVAARRLTLKLAARQIVAENTSVVASDATVSQRVDKPAIVVRKEAVLGLATPGKAIEQLDATHSQSLEGKASITLDVKVEEVRRGAFTEFLEAQYKQEMLKKMKRVTNMKDYYGTRTSVLGTVVQDPVRPPEERYCPHKQPRKPKIPKPNRRFANSKAVQPRPDRFNRKINRMLKKLWVKDHPLPVVEESLRDV